MDLNTAVTLLRSLRARKTIYRTAKNVAVTATHTAKFSPNDYAVGLVIPNRPEFYPTYVRLLIDLHVKRTSNPKDAIALFCALERVCAGEDPDKFVAVLSHLQFPMSLDDAIVNIYYAQLLMIEQDFNFGPGAKKVSKLNPPREFLMRFIRWVYYQDDQIDKIITNAVRNWPPPVRYKNKIDCN